MDEILAIVGGTDSLDRDIINLSKYRSPTLKPSNVLLNIAHKKKQKHPKDDMTKALEAYSLIDSAIGDTLNKDLMLLSNHRSAALVQTKVTNDDTIDMTKVTNDDTIDLTLISNQKSKALNGEGSVASVGSLGSAASSKSHRSAVISKDGSLKSLQRNSVSDNTVESSSIGTSKTPSVGASSVASSSVTKLPSLSSSHAQELRRQTIANKNLQSSNDFAGIINSLDELINSKALTDVLDCGHIPLLKLVNNDRGGLNTRGYLRENNSILSSRPGGIEFLPSLDSSSIMGASSILKSLNSLPRTFKKPQNKVSKKSKDDEKTVLLNTALEYRKNAKDILDSSRLYFEAAILFDEINMPEHAIENFEKAAERHNAALIVDTYDLPDSSMLQRKIERMSIYHKIPFLKKRAEIREELIYAEEERQRLRAIVSNCQLFRLHLRHSQFNQAYEKMNASFKDCSSTVEHSEVLWYSHNILKDFVNSGIIEIPYFDQVEHSTGGPLAEAHIHILNELIEQDGTNPELFDYLGLRYAQRSEFEQSRLYYKRARELRDPQCDPDEMIERWKMRPDRITEEKVFEAISKKYYLKYDNDIKVDEDIAVNRQDYLTFNGLHQSSNTKLYIPPDQGWEPSVNSLLAKYSTNVQFLNNLVNTNHPMYVTNKNLEKEIEREKKRENKEKELFNLRNISNGPILRYKDII